MSSVMIVGHGARTPVGVQAAPSAAAVRASIVRFSEHPFLCDATGSPFTCAFDRRLDLRVMGAERLLLLARSALREAARVLARAPDVPRRVPMYLATSEVRPGFGMKQIAQLRADIVRLSGLEVDVEDVEVIADGHAAGLLALERARKRIGRSVDDVCIVGGVDSYLQPDTLEWLERQRQLISAGARSGFVPGEAAGFLVLASQEAADRMRLSPLAQLLSVGVARETNLIKTSAVCVAEGLTAAVRAAAAALIPPEDKIDDIVCDLNGERYRTEEWGFVCLKAHRYFADPTRTIAPAESWGDVGAASGPLFAVLSCQAARRGYARGPRTLLWASSEGGLRAAAVVQTSRQERKDLLHG